MSKSGTHSTIHFISLGCSKNRVDTEVMFGVGGGEGYVHVADPALADVIVVNTCGFIDEAKRESIETVLEMAQHKKGGTCKQLVMAGCLSQRYATELAAELPEVDYFLGSSDMLKLRDVLRDEAPGRILVGNPADFTLSASDPRRISTRPHSVYVKIAEGCSRRCSFCAIPAIRGNQRSRPVADIVREVERLAESGAREINLISQDTVRYGRDLGEPAALETLLRALGDVPGIRWVRLFYLYPDGLNDAVIELMAAHPKIVPYVDMPLQHATDRMLRIMRRGYTERRQRALVEKLRMRIPGLAFRTAFIVGHPGETEADFAALCEFVRVSEFDHVGVFRYSHEEGTHSGELEHDVPAKVAAERQKKLMALQRRISRTRMGAYVGHELEVLVDAPDSAKSGMWVGRHAGQAPEVDGVVEIRKAQALQPGAFVRGRVVSAGDYDLVADFVRIESAAPAGQAAHATRTTRKARLPLATT